MGGNSNGRTPSVVRFGVFEVNLQTGELRKSGIRLRLQTQPFKILALLLQRPGEVVSREELQRELWGLDTNVDFEHGLGTAINKLRDALGDSSTAPRYVETLARRGYRFIGSVMPLEPVLTSVVVQSAALPTPQPPPFVAPKSSPPWPILAAALVGALMAAAITWLLAARQPNSTELARIRQVTWSGRVYPGEPDSEGFAKVVTDGIRLYFQVLEGGKFSIARAPLAGSGESNSPVSKLSTPAEVVTPTLADISPDGSKLLVEDHSWSSLEWSLWILPSEGGAAHRVANVFAHDATWMPDGQSVLYALGHDLWVTDETGDHPSVYAHLPGRGYWPRWSPDGRRLRLTIVDTVTRAMSLWEVDAGSRKPIPVFKHAGAGDWRCCGSWTPDGRSFLFQQAASGNSDIWLEQRGGDSLVQVTAGPLQYMAPVSAGKRDRLFVIGAQSHARLHRFDPRTARFVTFLPDLTTAGRFAFSPDGSKIAWVSTKDGSMWRSRPDGTERLQLTSPPFQIFLMNWSPDQQRLVIMGKHSGEPWRLYTIPAQGGDLKPLFNESRNQADPSWSADGRYIAFGRTPEYMGEEGSHKAIYILDTQTGTAKEVPGSNGLFSPRWSPDGRFIAAMPLGQRKLMLFDVATQQWTPLADVSVDNPVWTHDSKWVYFDAVMEVQKPIYRVRIQDKTLERVADIRNVDSADDFNYAFQGLSSDGAPVVSVNRWNADIFSIQPPAQSVPER